MGVILAAILFLAPQLTKSEARFYAKLVHYEATEAAIPPLLVVAIVQMESGWNHKAKGRTADYGLAQVHVSKNQYPELLGHEYLLYDPVINLHLGVRLMRYWRDWHDGHCYPAHIHPWWSHMKWGHRVKDGGRSARERAGKLYLKLLTRFTPKA
jgi:hypothetical protein